MHTRLKDRGAEAQGSSSSWSLRDAEELYRLDDWGMGFFGIADDGTVTVRPHRDDDAVINLYEVISGLVERGIRPPVSISFPEVLELRMASMARAFAEAMRENEYDGEYVAVYPIKVNQQRHLVEEVSSFGAKLGFGLEVGSKPELLAVMGLTAERPSRLIVCNGFKEERYIRHILLAHKMGRNIVTVIENLDELRILIEQAKSADIRPRIGVRLKLEPHSSGRWRSTTGEKAKFGLTIPGIVEAARQLQSVGMLDCLELLHCHMGSQISDIQVVNSGISEIVRVFVELHKMGASPSLIDVGGGLGVDYDGSKTNSDFSTNYSLTEYASTVVYRIMSICDELGVPHPTIITEAGRAMVSYHSLLVFNVLGSNRLDRWPADDNVAEAEAFSDQPPRVLDDLLTAYYSIQPERLLESYHDALQAREEALTLFNVGHLGLELRSIIDRLFWSACFKILEHARELDPMPEELQELDLKLSDTYFCNLSVFQSVPDSWAIDQLFPIMPLHRLREKPLRRGTIADITCDSDGKIDRFIDQLDVAPVLPLHELEKDIPYFLGIFLVGAYQETLGDLHNLFGDANLVHIRTTEEGGWEIDEVVEGDTVSEVLKQLQYEPRRLAQAIRRECERSVAAKKLSATELREILDAYESGLNGYTYLE